MIQIVSIQDVLDLQSGGMRSEMVLRTANGQVATVPVFPDQAAVIMQMLRSAGVAIQQAPAQPPAPAQRVAAQAAPVQQQQFQAPAQQVQQPTVAPSTHVPASPFQPTVQHVPASTVSQAAPVQQVTPQQVVEQFTQFGGDQVSAPAQQVDFASPFSGMEDLASAGMEPEGMIPGEQSGGPSQF